MKMFSLWCFTVQIFRSIDSNSVKGFPKDPKEATSKVKGHLLTVFSFL